MTEHFSSVVLLIASQAFFFIGLYYKHKMLKYKAALEAIAAMKREDLYYADGLPQDNAAAAYAAGTLKQ